MKTRLALLSVIALASLTASAHAQIISADFSESLYDGSDTLVANSPWTSTGALSLSTSGGGVDVTLSPSGLITLTDEVSVSGYTSLNISLTNVQISQGGAIVGISPILAQAVTDPASGTFLIPQSGFNPNTATLNFFTINSSTLSSVPDVSLNTADGVTTYQLTIVPEPRDWAMIVLLGLSGLVVARKLRDRYFPGLAFAI